MIMNFLNKIIYLSTLSLINWPNQFYVVQVLRQLVRLIELLKVVTRLLYIEFTCNHLNRDILFGKSFLFSYFFKCSTSK